MGSKKGFTLIEIIITIAVIGILAAVIFVAIRGVRERTRDTRRKLELAQIRNILVSSCYLPLSGAGDYDAKPILDEIADNSPELISSRLPQIPRDPSKGTLTESYYRYIVTASPRNCAVYGNLENSDEPVTLPNIAAPTAGGGTGVFEGAVGWNGTRKYFQIGN